jgi:hypothetical protein
MSMLNGYKTYIVAGATILFTLVQLWTGAIDASTAIFATLGALGLSGLRHGVEAR